MIQVRSAATTYTSRTGKTGILTGNTIEVRAHATDSPTIKHEVVWSDGETRFHPLWALDTIN